MTREFKTLAILLATLFSTSGCGDVEPQNGSAATDPAAAASTPATAIGRRPSPAGASVRFITPQDGDVVSSPVRVEFAVSGMELVPAGNDAANSGHHHILIDTDLPDLALPIPADAKHVHFGDGSSSAELVLSPGEHTLQLLFADFLHIPHDAPVHSEQITITVE